MATDQSIEELLAAADEALAEAGFRTGDFGIARDLAEQALARASETGHAFGHAEALNCLGMIAHYENITTLMSGSKPSSADVDSEERLFRQALLRWQELTSKPQAGQPQAEQSESAQAERPEGAQDDSTQAHGTQADGTEGRTEQPEGAQAGKPEGAQDDSTQADGTEGDGTEGGPEQPEGAQAGTAQARSAQAGSARALFGLGLVFQVLHSDWMTAMPYFWQALDLVSKPDLDAQAYLRSEVHRHVGFYFLVEDVQPSEAVRHLQLSLDYREELGDPRRIPSGLQALGQAELSAGNRDRAIDLLTRAVDQARAAGLAQERIKDAEQNLHEASGAADDDTPMADAGSSAPADPGSASAEPSTSADADGEVPSS